MLAAHITNVLDMCCICALVHASLASPEVMEGATITFSGLQGYGQQHIMWGGVVVWLAGHAHLSC
jgi:hypothetical protein